LRYVEKNKVDDHDLFLMAALFVDLAFDALVLKKISRSTVESMIEYLGIESRMLILSGINTGKNKFLTQLQKQEDLTLLETSFTEVAYRVVFQKQPDAIQLKEFQALLALTLTNGVGTISAKGAKESVSARNNIATAFGGFLVNTGLAHGGAGFEAIEFLLDAFKGTKLKDPAVLPAKTNLKDISNTVAINYLEFKQDAKQKGLMSYKRIPCINHPVFKGKPVNIDPREDYIYNYFKKLGIGNIFWDFYHDLVHSLFENGVSANVYCVNIDAVIAVISLKLMWGDYLKKKISDKEMQKIGFIIFLLGRMAGVSAEIADHRDRGQDMDTRTPVSETKFVV
jgi:citrate synthase